MSALNCNLRRYRWGQWGGRWGAVAAAAVEDTVVRHERAVGWAVYAALTAALVVPVVAGAYTRSLFGST